jgi:hypothetical protein
MGVASVASVAYGVGTGEATGGAHGTF